MTSTPAWGVQGAGFDAVFAEIDEFKKGKQCFLRAFFDETGFTFLRPKKTKIAPDAYKRLVQDAEAKGGPPELVDIDIRSRDSGKLVYRFSPFLEVEHAIQGERTTLTKLDYESIGHYPRENWLNFLDEALRHGLLSYDFEEHDDETLVRLVFKRYEPDRVSVRGSHLQLDDAFYSFMRTSERYPFRETKSDRFVVLVHEPHWDTRGHYQLIEGLRALIRRNPHLHYRFLVEGLAESEDIPATELDEMLSSDPRMRRVQVMQLVREFLIDSPMAYRLLYDVKMPAVAIDDQAELKERIARKELPGYQEVNRVFSEIERKLATDPSGEERKRVLELVGTTGGKTSMLFLAQLTGSDRVLLFEGVGDGLSVLAKDLATLPENPYRAEIAFLEDSAAAIKSEVRICKKALRRDKVMVGHIVEHFSSPVHGKRLPIAFIGNFHTPQILEALPSDMGYLVIEPRVTDYGDEFERKMFNRALLDYDTHLDAVLRGREKLRVAPPKKSMGKLKVHVEGIAKKQGQVSAKGAEESFRAISEAVGANGHLRGARIEVSGGGGGALPPLFDGAIGSFDPEGSGRGRIVLFNRGDKSPPGGGSEWVRNDRLRFFRLVVLPVAPKKSSRKARKVLFQQDPETKRIFFTVFDAESGSYYFFETDSLKGSKILEIPPTKGQIHMQLSDVFRTRNSRAA